MIEKTKYIQKTKESIWKEALTSDKEEVVNEVLQTIRKEGSIKILPDLLNLFLEKKNSPIAKKILSLLVDIKDENSKAIIFEAIENEKFRPVRKELLSVCWQSPLNYSDYLDKLTDLFLNEDFETAFEVFTIVENFDKLLDEAMAKNAIKKLKSNFDKVDQSKLVLLLDMVSNLEKILNK